jgi:hypothetical protein
MSTTVKQMLSPIHQVKETVLHSPTTADFVPGWE